MEVRPIVPMIGVAWLSACAGSPTGRKQRMPVSGQQAIGSSREGLRQQTKPYENEDKRASDPWVLNRVTWLVAHLPDARREHGVNEKVTGG